jgi:probable F420-dependent oxidoreductase
MELGIYVPNSHHGLGLEVFTAGKPFPPGLAVNPTTMLKVAQEAEAIGFDSIWVGDHIIFPPVTGSSHPVSNAPAGAALRSDQPIFDPLVVLSYLAHATTRVKLAIGVLIIPYRNPVLTAKWLATLDVLSGGRVLLGAGVGWLKDEFEAVDVPFESRGAMTDEYIQLMRELWTKDTPAFDGEHYHLNPGFAFLPKPIQKSIPIWVGGHSGLALKRAAKHGDGYFSAFASFDELAERKVKLEALLAAEDRLRSSFTFAGQARYCVYEEPYPDAPPCIGSPQKIADDIMRMQELGLEHLQIAPPPGPPTAVVLEQVRRFAEVVKPKLDL